MGDRDFVAIISEIPHHITRIVISGIQMSYFDCAKSSLRGPLPLIALMFISSACGGGSNGQSNPPPTPEVQSIAVSPANPSINVGTQQQFKAIATYTDGSMNDVTTSATWNSSDGNVATIGQDNGLADGLKAGTTNITASYAGVTNNPADTLSVIAPSAGVPALVQHVSSSNSQGATWSSPWCFHLTLPNGTQSGNAVLVGATAVNNVTLSVTDDQSDSYSVNRSYYQSIANFGQMIAVAGAFGVAGNARAINACFSGDPGSYVQVEATEFANIIGFDGAGSGNAGSGTTATSGNITPSQTGDLLYNIVFSRNLNNGWPAQTSFTPATQSNITWNLASADLVDGLAVQYGVYSSTSAINPEQALGTSNPWISAAVMLKAGSAGSVPTGFRIVHLIHENCPGGGGAGNQVGNPTYIEFPTSGNMFVAMISGPYGANVSSITDTQSNTWSQVRLDTVGSDDYAQIFYSASTTGANNLVLTVNWAAVGNSTILFYDVAGADSAPLDTSNAGSGSQSNTTGTLTMDYNITPAASDELVFTQIPWDYNTAVNVSPGLYDMNTFDGENLNGPEPVDENNGWGHYFTPDTSPVTFTWAQFSSSQPSENWVSNSAAFK